MKELVCRVCLCNGDLLSLFEDENEVPLAEKIMCCASVKVLPDDNLPSKICITCVDKLNISYQFKTLCEDSDTKLRKQEHLLKDKILPLPVIAVEVLHKNKKRDEEPQKKLKRKGLKRSDNRTILDNMTEVENGDNIVKQMTLSLKKEIKMNDICTYSDKDIGVNDLVDSLTDKKELKEKKLHDKKQNKEQCSTCGKIMSTRFRLRMHMRTHTGERPHSCNICGRSFTLAQSLKVHTRTHSGEKPLVCSVCGKSFAQYSGLAAHSRIHTGSLPYPCYICGQNFRTTGHLQYHIRKHTGEKKFACNICNRAFIMRADLTQHLKTHSGEKGYVCMLCGARMTRNSHLTRHMLTHYKEKSHVCNVCGVSFKQKSDRVKHEKRHSTAENKMHQSLSVKTNNSNVSSTDVDCNSPKRENCVS